MQKLNTILLIDDNAADNFYHQLMIEEAAVAADVVAFQYAEDALAYLQTPPSTAVDLIFLDINMPRMDGFQFLQAISELDAPPNAGKRFFVLTSSLNPLDRERALNYDQVVDFITKPLSAAMLQQLVQKHFS